MEKRYNEVQSRILRENLEKIETVLAQQDKLQHQQDGILEKIRRR
jgi:hypothetical protein